MADQLEYAGLVVPDDVLLGIVKARLEALQANPTLLARYFAGVAAEERDAFINYLTQKQIGVHLGFSPQVSYQAPQVVIAAAISQDDRPIGNELREAIINTDLRATVAADFTLTRQVLDPAIAGQVQDLKVASFVGTWPTHGVITVGAPDGDSDPASNIEVMSFDGIDTGVTPNVLKIIRRGLGGTKIVAHPATEVVALREKLRIYGLDQNAHYAIDVCHGNQRFVIILALMVQLALLQAERDNSLWEAGVRMPSMTVSDLAPHRMLYPNTIFVRTLHLSFKYVLALDEHIELLHRVEAEGTIVVPEWIDPTTP